MKLTSNGIHIAFAALLTVAAAACTSASSGEPSPGSAPGTVATWTKDFEQSAVLIADEILIEGPPGLRDHVAYEQIPGQKYEAKGTPDGFLQEVSRDPQSLEAAIKIHIDKLLINGVKSCRWLERPGAGPVRITARATAREPAYWKNLETGEERRAETIELVGQPAP